MLSQHVTQYKMYKDIYIHNYKYIGMAIYYVYSTGYLVMFACFNTLGCFRVKPLWHCCIL